MTIAPGRPLSVLGPAGDDAVSWGAVSWAPWLQGPCISQSAEMLPRSSLHSPQPDVRQLEAP